MLQPDLHDAPHEDREAPFGNALLLGRPTGRLSQAALRVPAQGPEAERWPTVATSGHHEQHDSAGSASGFRCHGYDRRYDPSAAHDLPGRRPGLQLRGPAATHHLKGRPPPPPPLVIRLILVPTRPQQTTGSSWLHTGANGVFSLAPSRHTILERRRRPEVERARTNDRIERETESERKRAGWW